MINFIDRTASAGLISIVASDSLASGSLTRQTGNASERLIE